MNDAHLHLVVNHMPIVGLLIGILTLIAGLIINKSQVKATALGVFIFSAITAIVANFTGEGAEEVVENISGISETLIHTHEELGEKFFLLMLFLGAISIVTLFLEIKKSQISKYLIFITLFVALGASVLAKYVGTSGGEIRHSEIRSDAQVIQLERDGDDD